MVMVMVMWRLANSAADTTAPVHTGNHAQREIRDSASPIVSRAIAVS
jgi:hypothetical protein